MPVYTILFEGESTQGATYLADAGFGQIRFGGTATTAASFAIIGSGQITFAGSCALAYQFTGSGSTSFAGAARLQAGYVFVCDLVLIFAGAGVETFNQHYTGSGQIIFNGLATTTQATYTTSGSGRITFAGSSITTSNKPYTGSGQIAFAGNATKIKANYNFVSDSNHDGWTSITLDEMVSSSVDYWSELSTDRSEALVLRGQATTTFNDSYTATGQIIFNGLATTQATYTTSGSGGITFAGSSIATPNKQYTGSGAIGFNGVGKIKANYNFVAEGTGNQGYTDIIISDWIEEGTENWAELPTNDLEGYVWNGQADLQYGYVCNGSGAIAFAGNATLSTWFEAGSGQLTFNGSATTQASYDYIGSGLLRFTTPPINPLVADAEAMPVFFGRVVSFPVFAGKVKAAPAFRAKALVNA